MSRSTTTIFAAAAAACFTGLAAADDFTFDFSSPTTTAYGSLSATPNLDGTFSVYIGELTVTSGGATGQYSLLTNPSGTAPVLSPTKYFIIDNQLLASHAVTLNVWGLLFGGNGAEINIWGNGAADNYIFYSHSGSGNVVAVGTFTLSAVPSPGVGAMASLGGVMFLGRRKRHA